MALKQTEGLPIAWRTGVQGMDCFQNVAHQEDGNNNTETHFVVMVPRGEHSTNQQVTAGVSRYQVK
jgi:hypothetical protein